GIGRATCIRSSPRKRGPRIANSTSAVVALDSRLRGKERKMGDAPLTLGRFPRPAPVGWVERKRNPSPASGGFRSAQPTLRSLFRGQFFQAVKRLHRLARRQVVRIKRGKGGGQKLLGRLLHVL